MALARRVIGVLASIMIGSLPVAAQSPGTSHRFGSTQGLSNVMVTIEGTGIGVFTNLEEAFTLTRVPAGARQVRARRIRYNSTGVTVTATVQALNTATADLVSVPVDCPFHH